MLSDDDLLTDRELDRIAEAESGENLNTLMHDRCYQVREAVASQGHKIEEMIKDLDPAVRAAAIRAGAGIPPLKENSSYSIDEAIGLIDSGVIPESLIHSEVVGIREMIVERGYALSEYVDDSTFDIRATVARQGYGLNTLHRDENPKVREAAKQHDYKPSMREFIAAVTIDPPLNTRRYRFSRLLHPKYHPVTAPKAGYRMSGIGKSQSMAMKALLLILILVPLTSIGSSNWMHPLLASALLGVAVFMLWFNMKNLVVREITPVDISESLTMHLVRTLWNYDYVSDRSYRVMYPRVKELWNLAKDPEKNHDDIERLCTEIAQKSRIINELARRPPALAVGRNGGTGSRLLDYVIVCEHEPDNQAGVQVPLLPHTGAGRTAPVHVRLRA